MSVVNLRIIEVLTVLKTLLIVPEKRLHLVGRRETDQKFARGVANKCPSVRYLARSEEWSRRVSGRNTRIQFQ